MKCDFCSTIIPQGSNECPKCGFKYRKITGIHSSTMEFDGIQEEKPYPVFDHIQLRVKKPIQKKNIDWFKLIASILIISAVLYTFYFTFFYSF